MALRALIRVGRDDTAQRFDVDADSFAAVPRSPFAYWVSDGLRQLFKEMPRFESDRRVARQGGVTGNDFRWLRLWTELVPSQSGRQVPFAKGGPHSPFYSDLPLTVAWDKDRNTFWGFTGLKHRPSLKPASFDYYFRPGLTWPIKNRFSLKPWPLPAGCVFAHVGPSAFVEENSAEQLLAMHAVMSSSTFTALLRIMAGWNFEVGLIQDTRFPDLSQADRSTLSALACRAWSLKRRLDTRSETSHAFELPALLQTKGDTIGARAAVCSEQVRIAQAELTTIQAEIDARCFDLYGIDEHDRRAITDGFGGVPDGYIEPNETEIEGDADEVGDLANGTGAADLVAELTSWAAGVAFGHFDVCLATGVRPLPTEPEPFDSLPLCSPGMLSGNDGLPPTDTPIGYPLALPGDGILVDDPGHARDLTAAVRAVFDEVFNVKADEVWDEVGALLDPKDRDLRKWLASSFFAYHLKRNSKSRRKAPIFWQLAVPSGRYSVWLRAHRLNRDSFFHIQNDVVAPKLSHEERQLTSLIQSAGPNPSANERREIAEQEAFADELRSFLGEVKRVAPLWNPSLEDGVLLTMAPLWRLVPQFKSWQKELRTSWGELAAGKYDWAHLAIHLWPERVIPKCASDRGLAIVHDLEEFFWVEGDDGKWKARPVPTRPVEELVRERASVAVKDALKSLLGAPAAGLTGGQRRGIRAASAKANEGVR
jgi:hypothetical protein